MYWAAVDAAQCLTRTFGLSTDSSRRLYSQPYRRPTNRHIPVLPTLTTLLRQHEALCHCHVSRRCARLAASANAQTAEQINSTAVSTRRAWCANQVAVCTNVCSQKTQQNLCNFNNLQFVCVCGNGTRLDFSNSDVDLTIVRTR
ncbi:hypothetical protein BCR44DRAFT_1283174 [Catenaria anguillulae PL171]|uniref:DUF7707 domain-containing protein n=1 Tax=Catenaria anguillulae PL171 TaxID=765915 RepID=A0A1Y2HW92_9FUNG|nr:hypothetical protein BCR44DRAFT_1283174 [Catenaria anguillulae PL171]